MRKHLEIGVMAALATATFFSQARLAQAGSAASITPTTDESGRKIYVNDAVAPAPRSREGKSQAAVPAQIFRSQQNRLVYWSSKDRRWKAVPHANVQAAQSAAAEVKSAEHAELFGSHRVYTTGD
jgi:hypothetical protein